MGVQANFVSAHGPVGPTLIHVPAKALHPGEGRMFAYVAENGRAVRRIVTTRRAGGGERLVTTGLDGGAHVIVSAGAPLKEGIEVREP